MSAERGRADEDAAWSRRERWQVLLGDGADVLGELGDEARRVQASLDYLYDRELEGGRNVRGGLGASNLTVPEWLNEITDLFPRQSVDRLTDDAVHRYGLTDLVTRRDVLERVEPSETLLRAVLATKHLMNPDVLALARRLVQQVIADLVLKLAPEIRTPFQGKRDPQRRSRAKIAANFDPRATIRANLRHVDPASRRLVISEPLFVNRVHRHAERWQLIILVDQSGSMLDSVIHAAVSASIFHGLGSLRTHLVAFDTSVVDLTDDVADPVETLMSVQLGGGTDIGQALRYAEQLVDTPRRTMVVMITDLFEGGDVDVLLGTAQRLVAAGSRLLVLGALDYSGRAQVDERIGAQLTKLGASLGTLTPFELADWVAGVVG